MSEWKRLALTRDESDDEKEQDLSPTPQMLHDEFKQSAHHLHEVQSMHTHVLVQAGMLPETHLAEVNPSQRLDWILEELHGMRGLLPTFRQRGTGVWRDCWCWP